MKCEFCGDKAKNTYETEAPFVIRACGKLKCRKKAVRKASKWQR